MKRPAKGRAVWLVFIGGLPAGCFLTCKEAKETADGCRFLGEVLDAKATSVVTIEVRKAVLS